MGLGTFAAGRYAMTYTPPATAPGGGGARTVGLVEDVKELSRKILAQEVKGDGYGEMPVEHIYLGAMVKLSMTLLEWTIAERSILWPFGGDNSAPDFGALGVISRSMYDLAGSIALTVATGTLAATNGPASITISKAIIDPDTDVKVLFAPTLRKIPIVFHCYPYTDSGLRQFTTVAASGAAS